jgi:hypothetical protein
MFSLYPDNGLMPPDKMQNKPAQPQIQSAQVLMEQIKHRMQEEQGDNDVFDHVPRAGDDVGA